MIAKLFRHHEYKDRIIDIIQKGSQYHLSPIYEATSISDLDAMILRVNNKLSKSNLNAAALDKAMGKEAEHFWDLHADSFIINIVIASIHILNSNIFGCQQCFLEYKCSHLWKSLFHSTTVLSGIFWKSYLNVPINSYDGPFFFNGRQWNRLPDEVVTILKYLKSTIHHSIYIKVFSDITVLYLMVYNDNVLNITNNLT